MPRSPILAIAIATALTAGAEAASFDQVPHKALYTMELSSSKSGSPVVSVTGEMAYEWKDSCDSWTTDQKFTLDYLYSEGPEARFNSEYSAVEAKDDSSYSFSVRRFRNAELTEEFRGSAHRDSRTKAGSVDFTRPEKKTVALPAGFYFPSMHTIRVLEAAQRGEHILNGTMFDGSDGDGAVEVNAVIGGVVKASVTPGISSPLLDSPAHKVRLAFYGKDPEKGDASQPDNEMSMVLHDNGVISDMRIDYDDFSIHGTLKAIEATKPAKC